MAAKKDNTEKDKGKGTGDKYLDVLASLETRFGKGTTISGKTVKDTVEVISTGSLTLDMATMIGGWPIGCLIEVFGMESSGKTTICLHAIANFQKKNDGEVVFVNPEHAFDRLYATNIGVDVDRLTISQPDCQEDMYNIIQALVESGKVRLVVIDSHTASLPKAVIEGELGEVKMALAARNNSIGLGKLKPLLKPNRCTIIAISQLRADIGGYGDTNKPSGGNAWKFYSDMRMKVFKEANKEKGFNKTTAEIVKSKVGEPFAKAVFNIGGSKGIDSIQEIIDIATEYKILSKQGAWFTLEGGTKIQGDSGMKEMFLDNPSYMESIKQQVMDKLKQNR